MKQLAELNSLLWELNKLNDPFEEENIRCLFVKTHGAGLNNWLKRLKSRTSRQYHLIVQNGEIVLRKIEEKTKI